MGAVTGWRFLCLTDTERAEYSQKADSGWVVCEADDGYDQQIYLYDLAAATLTQVTNNSGWEVDPEIDHGQVVFSGDDDLMVSCTFATWRHATWSD